MNALRMIWSNEYLRLTVYLAACYVFVHSFNFPFDYFDYIIVVYILVLRRVDESNALKYAVLFGLFYDLSYHIYLGLGVLLFMLLNFIKVQANNMMDLNKINYRVLFPLFMLLLYLLLTLLFHGYAGYVYWRAFAAYLAADLVALVLLGVLVGGRRAVWSS